MECMATGLKALDGLEFSGAIDPFINASKAFVFSMHMFHFCSHFKCISEHALDV